MVKYDTQQIDRTFYALSDTTRREILFRLTKQDDLTIMEIAKPYEMSLPAVSKHIKILEECGMVNRKVDGRVHTISLNTKPMRDAYNWLEYYSRFWETKLGSLKQYLENKERDSDE